MKYNIHSQLFQNSIFFGGGGQFTWDRILNHQSFISDKYTCLLHACILTLSVAMILVNVSLNI